MLPVPIPQILSQIIAKRKYDDVGPSFAHAPLHSPNSLAHGLQIPNEGINQRYLKNWADVADKICFGRT